MKRMTERMGAWRGVLAMAGCLAAMAVQGAAAETGAEKLGWQLAVHSYTFQKFSIEEAIDKTAALGIRHMSISGSVNLVKDGKVVKSPTPGISAETYAAIRGRMVEKGMSPDFVNMGVVKPVADEAESRKLFEAAKRLGIRVLVAEPETGGKVEALGPVMDVVEKLAVEYGIKVAIHNHPKPSFYWSPEIMLQAVEGRSPLLGVCADVGHWVRSGLDPVECLRKLEGRVITLHFKDLSEKGPKAHDVPWGTGISGVKAMLSELKRQGFKGAFCIEYEHNWDNSSAEIGECAKYFHAACEELAAK